MDHHPLAHGSIARRIVLTALTTVLVSLGITLISNGAQSQTPPPQPGAAQAFATRSGTAGPPRFTAAPALPMPRSVPTKVRIPAIHVDAPLTDLGLQANGRLTAPPDDNRNLAGWYRDGTPPGSIGTAIVAGHVDTRQGPAVFYNLGALTKGTTVEIDRSDGRTAVFTIDAIEVYRAADFPDQKVYAPATRPELRLITCGGGFDKKHQQYLGNVVAYAHLTSTRP
jgi:hypothetical protein